MDTTTSNDSTPALFRLPLELRQQIYDYLIPEENISHPVPSVGITSVSHRPPSLALLTTHSRLTAELLEYFRSLATWKLVFSHAFNFFRVDPDLENLKRSTVLHALRRVELVFFCDILLLHDYPSFGLAKFCAEIRRRAERACDVLASAPTLQAVTVSWIDTTCTRDWADKAQVLQPLRRLANEHIQFRVGEVTGSDDVDRKIFTQAVLNVVGSANFVESGEEGTRTGPGHIRMLAFDVRQERKLCRMVDLSERRVFVKRRTGQ